ncbi:MAG TPA: hypothetical protein VIB38_12915 [Aestuariivirgaceae bacterium]|jgi:hypothetical protein
MTMRVIDVAPNEVLLASLADRLEKASSGSEPISERDVQSLLELDPDFAEAARAMLREFIEGTNH